MDPNQPVAPDPVDNTTQQSTIKDKVSESVGEFASNNYEGFLHKLVNFVFIVLNFIKNSIMNMISQVLNKE